MPAEHASFAMVSAPETARLQWERDGIDWPLREYSRFVAAGNLRWHVQQLGAGPALLLIHGTGASSHSWRGLAPLLATRYQVTLCDLPGHGFTSGRPRRGMSLDGFSDALTELVQCLNLQPHIVVGHSAGAAIAVRMSLDRGVTPQHLVSINGALLPLHPIRHALFAPIARLLAGTTWSSQLFAWGARDRAAVKRLIDSTGSTLDERSVDLYWRLVRNQVHVDGALQMMAQWNLERLQQQLPRLTTPLTLIVGTNDRTVPPEDAVRAERLLPSAVIARLAGLGHLAHEEQPQAVADVIVSTDEARAIG